MVNLVNQPAWLQRFQVSQVHGLHGRLGPIAAAPDRHQHAPVGLVLGNTWRAVRRRCLSGAVPPDIALGMYQQEPLRLIHGSTIVTIVDSMWLVDWWKLWLIDEWILIFSWNNLIDQVVDPWLVNGSTIGQALVYTWLIKYQMMRLCIVGLSSYVSPVTSQSYDCSSLRGYPDGLETMHILNTYHG